MDDSRWQCAVTAMLLILDLYEREGGEPKHVIAAKVQFIVLRCLETYEVELTERRRSVLAPLNAEPSLN